jgi:hypothetical protein
MHGVDPDNAPDRLTLGVPFRAYPAQHEAIPPGRVKGTTPMTIKTFATTLALSTALVGAAQANTTLAANGYWTTVYETPATPTPNSSQACTLLTSMDNGTRVFSISVNSADQRLRVNFQKTSWQLPKGAYMSAKFQIDSGAPWEQSGPGNPGAAWISPQQMSIYLNPVGAQDFIHQFTSGMTMNVQFTGDEAPWRMSLWGTTASFASFMKCAQTIAPSFAASFAPPTSPVAPMPTSPAAPAPINPIPASPATPTV